MRQRLIRSFLLLALMVLLTGGAVTAYFQDQIPVENVSFTSGTVEIGVGEPAITKWTNSFVNKKEVEWIITNLGSKPVKLRVKVDHEQVCFKGKPAIAYEVLGNWVESDGYYYYPDVLAVSGPGEEVKFTLRITRLLPWWGNFTIDIEAEAIQASNSASSIWSGNPY